MQETTALSIRPTRSQASDLTFLCIHEYAPEATQVFNTPWGRPQQTYWDSIIDKSHVSLPQLHANTLPGVMQQLKAVLFYS